MLKRYSGNPILQPIKEHPWEALMVYNCAAVYEEGKIHLVYRAQGSPEGVSSLGYARSSDGFQIEERLASPVFEPEPGNEYERFGCEDPRLTRIGNRFYMTYSAYGRVPNMAAEARLVQIGMTSISVKDFVKKNWRWSERGYPLLRVDNKSAVLFPEKIQGKYVMYHRIAPYIWVSYSTDLRNWFGHKIVMTPEEEWEYFRVSAGAPPIRTKKGWFLIYHGVDSKYCYRLGFVVIDRENPEKIIYRPKTPILEPEEKYERSGVVPNAIFNCGAVVVDDELFIYYGAADTVVAVATANMSEILSLI